MSRLGGRAISGEATAGQDTATTLPPDPRQDPDGYLDYLVGSHLDYLVETLEQDLNRVVARVVEDARLIVQRMRTATRREISERSWKP